MIVTPIRTRVFREGEDIFEFLDEALPLIRDRSIVAVTSKIVALSEGRTAEIENEKTKEEWIRRESEYVVRGKYTWLSLRDGVVLSSAGIDESNANGKLVLLPRDSFRSAENIRAYLQKRFCVENIGVIVTDSRAILLRAGAIGMAVGYAGFSGLKEYCGKPDIFGRILRFERVNIADSLAVSTVLTMGEGDEQQPIAIVEDAPVTFSQEVSRDELLIDIEEDLYRPFFSKFPFRDK